MSVSQYATDAITAYDDAQHLYHKWRRQRQEIIKKLRELSSEIQQSETKHKKGSVAYSSVGIVAGTMTIAGILGAPFTFGGSLGLTAMGTTAGIASGTAAIAHTVYNCRQLKLKCDEASTLLADDQRQTENLLKQLQIFHVARSLFCTAVDVGNLSARTLGSIAGVSGDALAKLLAVNLPNVEKSSRGLSAILYFGQMKFGVSLGATNSVAVPMVGRQAASNIVKNSARVIGTAAVGAGIIMDVLSLVNNKKSLDTKKICEQADALEKIAIKMEEEMIDLEKIFNKKLSA